MVRAEAATLHSLQQATPTCTEGSTATPSVNPLKSPLIAA